MLSRRRGGFLLSRTRLVRRSTRKSTAKNFYSIVLSRTDERTRAEGGGVGSLAARARGRDARTCARAPHREDDPRRALASVHERSLAIHRPPRLRRRPPVGVSWDAAGVAGAGRRGASRKSRTSYPYGGVSNGARATVQTTCSTLSSDEIEIRGYTRSMRFLIGEFSGFANPEISRRWR